MNWGQRMDERRQEIRVKFGLSSSPFPNFLSIFSPNKFFKLTSIDLNARRQQFVFGGASTQPLIMHLFGSSPLAPKKAEKEWGRLGDQFETQRLNLVTQVAARIFLSRVPIPKQFVRPFAVNWGVDVFVFCLWEKPTFCSISGTLFQLIWSLLVGVL